MAWWNLAKTIFKRYIDEASKEAAIRELFGSLGENPAILSLFICDNGRNIHVGDNFLANYNVTILDVDEVCIGNHVMIGPNTLISTMSPHDTYGAA